MMLLVDVNELRYIRRHNVAREAQRANLIKVVPNHKQDDDDPPAFAVHNASRVFLKLGNQYEQGCYFGGKDSDANVPAQRPSTNMEPAALWQACMVSNNIPAADKATIQNAVVLNMPGENEDTYLDRLFFFAAKVHAMHRVDVRSLSPTQAATLMGQTATVLLWLDEIYRHDPGYLRRTFFYDNMDVPTDVFQDALIIPKSTRTPLQLAGPVWAPVTGHVLRVRLNYANLAMTELFEDWQTFGGFNRQRIVDHDPNFHWTAELPWNNGPPPANIQQMVNQHQTTNGPRIPYPTMEARIQQLLQNGIRIPPGPAAGVFIFGNF